MLAIGRTYNAMYSHRNSQTLSVYLLTLNSVGDLLVNNQEINLLVVNGET